MKNLIILYSGQLRNFEENIQKIPESNNYNVYILFSVWRQRGGIDKAKIQKFSDRLELKIFGRKITLLKTSLIERYKISSPLGDVQKKDLEKISKYIDIKDQGNNCHDEIDGFRLNSVIKKLEPIYYRGMLPMLERNYAGLALLKRIPNLSDDDILIRTQGDVHINFSKLFKYLDTAELNKIHFESDSVDPTRQLSTKFVFSSVAIMRTYLNVIHEYCSIQIDEDKSGDLDNLVGERYLYQWALRRRIELVPLQAIDWVTINRQKVKAILGIYMPKTLSHYYDDFLRKYNKKT